jgi:Uma2 family endonuclease
MSTQPVPHLTFDQYLEIERAAEFRSEYMHGQMYAMAGASRNHGRIVANAMASLWEQLRGRDCEAASNDLRVYSAPAGVSLYPDIVVTCGPDKFHDKLFDTLVDATSIIEVLSPSTRNFDRGEKFHYYRALPSFAEYLLLSQDAIRAEHYARQPDGSWLFREFTNPGDVIELKSIGCRLTLESLYERVVFDAA